MSKRSLVLLVSAGAPPTTTLPATLVLRSGRRVEGALIAVRGSTVEFAEEGGSSRRYDRSDVARIELNASSYDDVRPGGRPSGMRENSQLPAITRSASLPNLTTMVSRLMPWCCSW